MTWRNFPPDPWLESTARLCRQAGLAGLGATGGMTGQGQGTVARLSAAAGRMATIVACLDRTWPRTERCCPPAYELRGAGRAMLQAGRDLLSRLRAIPTAQGARDLLWNETARWFATTRAEAVRLGATSAAACIPADLSWADGVTPVVPIDVPIPSPTTAPTWDSPADAGYAPPTADRAASPAFWLVGGLAIAAIAGVSFFAFRR